MLSDTKIVTITLNPAIDQTIAIDNFTAGMVNRVQTVRNDAGGKGVNVAACLSDYGFQVTVTGFIGEKNSDLFEHLFELKRIQDRFLRIDGDTRTGIKIIDKIQQETTDINFPGQVPGPRHVQELFRVIDGLNSKHVWFVIAGSIPSGTSVKIYRELICKIKEKGGQVALDSTGEGFRQAINAIPSMVKPNIEELQEFCGHTLNSREEAIGAARQLLNRGIQTVVVSMGKEGALFLENDVVIHAKPPEVVVESTVGAGDAMLSGMVAGKIEHKSLGECARLATAFSVVAVSNIGAGIPSRTDLDSIRLKVELDVIRG
ncbi:MAG: 1-phosphofructokinase [Desulfobacteraceae bacterium]|nr:1-phosphofructokinase [Desulfobacteraceae bacterium]